MITEAAKESTVRRHAIVCESQKKDATLKLTKIKPIIFQVSPIVVYSGKLLCF